MADTQLISHFGANLGYASLLVLITATIHFFGLAAFSFVMNAPLWRHTHVHRPFWQRYLVILAVVLGLFGLHTVEIWTYAVFYLYGLNAFADFEQSLYFSTISFVSLGNGDVLMPRAWRLVGAIEAVNGVILLGWSTAFFITIVTRLRILEHEWLEKLSPDKKNEEEPSKLH